MPSEVYKPSFLSVLASLVLVIASLYWAKAVLIPLALALMLTFLLQPIVAALHRRGLGRFRQRAEQMRAALNRDRVFCLRHSCTPFPWTRRLLAIEGTRQPEREIPRIGASGVGLLWAEEFTARLGIALLRRQIFREARVLPLLA